MPIRSGDAAQRPDGAGPYSERPDGGSLSPMLYGSGESIELGVRLRRCLLAT